MVTAQESDDSATLFVEAAAAYGGEVLIEHLTIGTHAVGVGIKMPSGTDWKKSIKKQFNYACVQGVAF